MQNEKKVVELNINDVLPNRFQPRIKFDENSINELAVSIRKYGVIQPIVVRKIGDKYEIIAGERRYKASVIAGKATIPAIVYDLSDTDSVEIALIENVQREDLTPIEKAISYKKILDMGYMNQEQLAQKIGKSQSTIANTLRLLGLSDEVQEALLENKISERHARSLLKLKDDEDQVYMLNRIINERLTVRKTDEEIEKMLNGNNDEVITIPDTPVAQEPITAPGFMNIDNIAANAQDIIKEEKPMPNMDNLLKADAPMPAQVEETSDDELLQPGKFFNFFGEETTSAPDTNYNFNNFFNFDSQEQELASKVEPTPVMEQPVMPTYEVPVENTYVQPAPMMEQPVMPTYEAPIENTYAQPAPMMEQPVMPTYEAPVENTYVQPAPMMEQPVMPTYEAPVENTYVQSTPMMEQPAMPMYEAPVENTYVQPAPMMEQPVMPTYEAPVENTYVQPTPMMEQPVMPTYETPVETNYNIPTAPVYDANTPQAPTPDMPAYTIPTAMSYTQPIEQPVAPQSMAPVTKDLRGAINMVRDCANNLEFQGYTVDVEEIDFEDSYQVIFKISKN